MPVAAWQLMGSSSLCVVAISVEWQHACPEQLGASSAIHRTLDCFQAIDLAFRLTVAARQCDGVVDGDKIAVQDVCESRNCDQTRVGITPREGRYDEAILEIVDVLKFIQEYMRISATERRLHDLPRL
ncbi:hypothetical protein J2W42_006879 [Rhizobium tibeticum]|nr:hypothetical protein [Rhizobium tibeticum]